MKRKLELIRIFSVSFIIFGLMIGVFTFKSEFGEPSYIVGRGSQIIQSNNNYRDDLYIVGYGFKNNKQKVQTYEDKYIVGRGLVNPNHPPLQHQGYLPSYIIGRGRMH